MIKIFIDGGARGNPGPAAIGVVIQDEKKNREKEYGFAVGKCTNNQAEYQALIFALKKARALYGKKRLKTEKVEILSDSELLVKQMQGKYKIEDKNIQLLFLEAWNLKIDFHNIAFKQISREQNKKADQVLNQALDAKTKLRLL